MQVPGRRDGTAAAPRLHRGGDAAAAAADAAAGIIVVNAIGVAPSRPCRTALLPSRCTGGARARVHRLPLATVFLTFCDDFERHGPGPPRRQSTAKRIKNSITEETTLGFVQGVMLRTRIVNYSSV